jgi:hypothetical protein
MKSLITVAALLTLSSFSFAGPYDRFYNCEMNGLTAQGNVETGKFSLNITFPENVMKGTAEVIYTSEKGVTSRTLLSRVSDNKFRMVGITFAKKQNPRAHGIQGSIWNVLMMDRTAFLTIQETGMHYSAYRCTTTAE